MHKLISTVFKVLALSMLFMLILDTSLLLIEIVSTHSRVSNLTGIMQMEVARNNCMPTAMAETFEEALNEIENGSTLMDKFGTRGDSLNYIKTNMKSNLGSVESLKPANAKDYGQFVDLVIEVELHPTYAYYNPNRTGTNDSWLNMVDSEMVLKYEYRVPCLRYLK